MVAISDRLPEMTPQEYLEWEEQQPIKHEYVNGYVYAMAGGTIPHNIIAVNLTNALKNHLKGKGCLVLSADAKLGMGVVKSSCGPIPPKPPLPKGGAPEAPLFKGGLGGSGDWEGHPNDQRVLTTPTRHF